MTNKEHNTRFSPKEALILDFAEHLKYSLDADEFHNTSVARYTALALSIRDRIIHQWHQSRQTQRQVGGQKGLLPLPRVPHGAGDDQQRHQHEP